ncbi:hypothetical protein DACRYDRAFT_107037 [Dacryopinax primogenitus]|uniref:Uncharacterized protein n=1 Tax=Dacryopinax primogenitus (strain DJM 731) TaxID=1858805 RepID=M5G8A0_DACPD|nr:uncharacterized protein DACRYDRAFT_107037 [Dacryopinax primogenitus]EJU02092.1 hypothetical protein DACRYDRAFT_107037 [Dacryopinax primogenitus]
MYCYTLEIGGLVLPEAEDVLSGMTNAFIQSSGDVNGMHLGMLMLAVIPDPSSLAKARKTLRQQDLLEEQR